MTRRVVSVVCGAVAALAIGLTAVSAQAQSLAEVARLEAERRKGLEPGPVYTNADLAPTGAAPAITATDPAAAASDGDTAGGDARGDGDEGDVIIEGADRRDEDYWRARARAYADRLQALRDEMAALQQPAGAMSAEVEAVLARLKRNLGFLEDEHRRFLTLARSRDVPADWLR